MNNKTAIYIRVSTHWQVDRDSLQVQRRELIAYSELVLNIQEYEVFEDPGYSAKNTDRPAYQTMMSRLRTGEFSHLLVWKIDRISRNLLDFAEMYAELKKLGVIFVSKNEQFDTSSAIGEAMLKIILVFAELERKMTAERVTAIMLSRASDGRWNGGIPPFGYSVVDDSITVNQEEALLYRQIVEDYMNGYSASEIATKMNSLGIVTRRNKQWAHVNVLRILNSRFYLGEYSYNKRDGSSKKNKPQKEWIVVKDHHAPLITEDEFDALQREIARRRRDGTKPGDSYTYKYTHILAGLVRCGRCGSNMIALRDHKRKNGTTPSVYLCSKRKNGIEKCPNMLVGDTKLIPFVMSVVGNVLEAQKTVVRNTSVKTLKTRLLQSRFDDSQLALDIDAEDVKNLLTALKSVAKHQEYLPQHGYDVESNRLQVQKQKYETALTRLHSLYLYGDSSMSEAQYIIERAEIEREIAQINERMKKVPKDVFTDQQELSFKRMSKMLETKFDYAEFATTVSPSVPKDFLNRILDHISVTDQKVTEIVFKNGFVLHFLYEQPSE